MKLVELLNPKAVSADLKAQNKGDVVSELLDLLVTSGDIKKADRPVILKKLNDREALGSTGIGKGVGIPHAKCLSVKKMVAAIGISKKGVDFKSLDGDPAHLFFLLIAPGANPGPHLKSLAKIARLLDDKFVRDRLRSSKTPQEILSIVKAEEQKNIS